MEDKKSTTERANEINERLDNSFNNHCKYETKNSEKNVSNFTKAIKEENTKELKKNRYNGLKKTFNKVSEKIITRELKGDEKISNWIKELEKNNLNIRQRRDLGRISHNTPLVLRYEEIQKDLTDEKELRNIDLFPLLAKEIYSRISQNRLCTITIRGEASLGKSTVALALCKIFSDIIKELGKNTNIDMWKNIVSDQVEFNRFIMKTENWVCCVIDEWSELGTTGRNSSSELSLFNYYTDVCAQRYVHRIMCTPKANSLYDASSMFLIDVRGRNKETGETLCNISYNSPTGTSVFLGVFYIDVNKVLKDPSYEGKYRKKKFARISFMDKYGLRDVRELETANVILTVYNELLPLVNSEEKISRDLIPIIAETTLQENKLIYSIIAQYDLERPIYALLNLAHVIKKLEKGLAKPIPEEKRKTKEKMLKIASEQLTKIISNYENKSKLLEEYLAINY